MPTIFEVNKPFPGPVPAGEGTVMELWQDGLTALIQAPKCRSAEIQAFHFRSFDQYAYLETSTPVPIAVWIFDFSQPLGQLDTNFSARIAKPEYLADYLDAEGGVKNRIFFYLLDRQILRGIKMVGLDPAAVQLFHATIRKQLAQPYSQEEYGRHLAAVYKSTTAELWRLGKKFEK